MKKLFVAALLLVAMIMTLPSASAQTIGDSGVIACIGDSITYGAGVNKTRDTESFPAMLQALLGDNWIVYNYGNRGSTLLSGTNHPYRDQQEYLDSIAEPADVYIIMLGTNDAKEQFWDAERFLEEYAQFLDIYREINAEAQIYLMLPPTVYSADTAKPEYFGPMEENVHNSVVDTVRAFAESQDLPVIDLHTLTAGHPEWFADGLHPNAEGNRAISELIYSVLTH